MNKTIYWSHLTTQSIYYCHQTNKQKDIHRNDDNKNIISNYKLNSCQINKKHKIPQSMPFLLVGQTLQILPGTTP